MIAIVDYGVGNLFSLRCSLAALGLQATVTGQADEILAAHRVILPGVGAFGDAMAKLHTTGMDAVVKQAAGQGKPLLGICLGMQLLFEESEEFGHHAGLGLIQGRVAPLEPDLRAAGHNYKVPHMGWNPLELVKKDCPLLHNSRQGQYMYYVHSFYAKNCNRALAATSEYGVQVPGVVWAGNVYGTQFHPEKSGDDGLQILKAFAEVV